MLNLFKRRPKPQPKPAPKLEFKPRLAEIRIRDWRRNTELVSIARTIIKDPRFERMLTTLETESPANFAFAGVVDLAQRAVVQAQVEGYNRALNNLISLGEAIEDQEPLKETYEPEDQELEQQTEK